MRVFVGLTGASGHAYAEQLVLALLRLGHDVDLCATSAGLKVLRHELGIDAGARGERLAAEFARRAGPAARGGARAFAEDEIEAPPSSGTSLTGGIVLCPCSMGTLARVSAGFSSNLVERAADVALKEGRRLVLVPREAPYSALHLENMLRLARMGAVILPASPGFYHRPRTLDDLVLHVVGKILDRLGIAHELGARWKGMARGMEPGMEPAPDAPPEDPGTGLPPPSPIVP